MGDKPFDARAEADKILTAYMHDSWVFDTECLADALQRAYAAGQAAARMRQATPTPSATAQLSEGQVREAVNKFYIDESGAVDCAGLAERLNALLRSQPQMEKSDGKN